MQSFLGKYELVIGLEIHAQLLTNTKLFCGDGVAFNQEPNTLISPITLGHPGTLPKLNTRAVEFAIRMGMACNCEISRDNYFARKNYFYPDLPKGYQITQHTTPICKGGFVNILTSAGRKKILLNRIHLEEDAGKSSHDLFPDSTAVDYNRAGVPLIEIVTEPELRSSDEAWSFLTELRKVLRYTGVCDGNMEEGSMRCDANVSVRPIGDKALGVKVEVKNLNSIKNVKRAIESEAQRLVELSEQGKPILQETRSFDPGSGITSAMRSKEDANDYRYFADPDLTPFTVTDTMLATIAASMPALPEQLIEKFTTNLGLSNYDASVITDDKATADFFQQIILATDNYKAAANWILGPVKSWTNDQDLDIDEFPIQPSGIANLILLVDQGHVSFSIASTRILPLLIKEPNSSPLDIAKSLNLLQNSDSHTITAWVDEVLQKMPDKVLEYKKGKKGLIGLFVGEIKKLSKGKADLQLTNKILLEKLK